MMSQQTPEPTVPGTLLRVFGFSTLRPLQEEAIAATLQGRDALVVMPTGGGKSLCYQLPPLITGRLTVVVSPLIALMQDQVDGLRLLGYPAAASHSNLDEAERERLRGMAADGTLRLLFLAPERLFNPSILHWLQRQGVGAIAIDEAHCISQWGHDFRPEYRRLAELRAHLPGVPVQAYTATATPRVRSDISEQLRLQNPAMLVGRFDRPNLTYRILPRTDLERQVTEAIGRHPDAASIVYCISRKDTEGLAAALQARGLHAAPYHAGLGAEERTRVSQEFRAERLPIVVATVAFGMGIDRSDVRLVVHAALPKSLEGYQQETGRAGRDGLPAECLLLYSASDMPKWRRILESRAAEAEGEAGAPDPALDLLDQMQRFVRAVRCRHRALSEYFGQAYEGESCGACDHCLAELELVPESTVLAQKILSAVVRTGQRFGNRHVADVLRGRVTEKIRTQGHHEIPTFGAMADVPPAALGNFIDQLVDQGLLLRTGDRYPVLSVSPEGSAVLRGQAEAVFRVPKGSLETPRHRRTERRGRGDAFVGLSAADEPLFAALRAVRKRLAQDLEVPPYVVFSDATLEEMARRRPANEEQFARIRGVGQKKLESFASTFLEAIASFDPPEVPWQDEDHLPEGEGDSPPRRPGTPAPTDARKLANTLFQDGASVEEVAQHIGRAVSTTFGYLTDFIRTERPPTIAPWVPEAMEVQVRSALVHRVEGRLKPVFEALEGTVPYDIIRIVAAFVDEPE